ncbi:MAG: Holliday junction branch migration protein RuvA [Actinobacteria bacterium]|nr:Holliday junction branch migration protein RuvA [Actinomycetota bacterium]
MISKISGKLLNKSPSFIIVKSGGIGFEILISGKTFEKLPSINTEIEINTYLHIRENELKLVGFATPEEKEFFLKLLEVSGVSIKIGLSALSIYTVDEIKSAIINGEVELLRRIPGIGKKLAERIILELREKLSQDAEVSRIDFLWENEKVSEARQALKALGYSSQEISRALAKIKNINLNDMRTEDLVKLLLKEV